MKLTTFFILTGLIPVILTVISMVFSKLCTLMLSSMHKCTNTRREMYHKKMEKAKESFDSFQQSLKAEGKVTSSKWWLYGGCGLTEEVVVVRRKEDEVSL